MFSNSCSVFNLICCLWISYFFSWDSIPSLYNLSDSFFFSGIVLLFVVHTTVFLVFFASCYCQCSYLFYDDQSYSLLHYVDYFDWHGYIIGMFCPKLSASVLNLGEGSLFCIYVWMLVTMYSTHSIDSSCFIQKSLANYSISSPS